MEALATMDSLMLAGEMFGSAMHVGIVLILTPPADAGPDYVDELYRDSITGSYELDPRLRRHPHRGLDTGGVWMWRDIDEVDLRKHVHYRRLPKGSGADGLWQLVGDLHSERLEMSGPRDELSHRRPRRRPSRALHQGWGPPHRHRRRRRPADDQRLAVGGPRTALDAAVLRRQVRPRTCARARPRARIAPPLAAAQPVRRGPRDRRRRRRRPGLTRRVAAAELANIFGAWPRHRGGPPGGPAHPLQRQAGTAARRRRNRPRRRPGSRPFRRPPASPATT